MIQNMEIEIQKDEINLSVLMFINIFLQRKFFHCFKFFNSTQQNIKEIALCGYYYLFLKNCTCFTNI